MSAAPVMLARAATAAAARVSALVRGREARPALALAVASGEAPRLAEVRAVRVLAAEAAQEAPEGSATQHAADAANAALWCWEGVLDPGIAWTAPGYAKAALRSAEDAERAAGVEPSALEAFRAAGGGRAL